ncbi:PREDICTED: membrane-associated guanylate kinase, WW and PDZ domain-containing protein 1 [Nicrophorus vespilloides]|uniref:Membrane-associated guanylate kinase, WW and PDZ domain-containing protein 1 n=1 Tax=Nicrophorus vespilloides TaxID=110193 RepID=A0ABM1N8D8_NICVS|nr:PREDICTED: membrane-associated guanylate kinase, WW and PDZ domain-containing protein 1 [Nicrophorus vespilloides]XP_017783088.1 PREDICTED: membrane-associated guanylate kinase, WW and PDZ domain-containing protein 1 [Nicrophorus vespilloides]
MSHKSDKSSLSQPLRVETEENVHPEGNNYFDEDTPHSNDNEDTESLGPLPPKWEKAYTESGEVYFIDHASGTSHWLDPRLSKFQKKSLEDCMDDELPYGWEKISDPNYGTYFIDHVNRRTQYENPVIEAKRAASQASARVSRASFTKDPSELCGQRFRTSLVKSSRGLGFTIVGGDDGIDEFLQIKSVVPKGPAWLDGKLQTGDVIVFVNDTCVLGYTHNQIVRLFQSISVGSTVTLELCRGYPLPFDPNDPNTEVVTTIAVDLRLQTVPNEKRLANLDTNYNFLDGDDISRDEGSAIDNNDDIEDILKGINLSVTKVEVSVKIVKGNLGFGFTIADSACGQRVKKILDRQRCKNLMEGDILLEINEIPLQNMSHDDVVQVLKNCPYNNEATICVQRGCNSKPLIARNKPRKLDNRFNSKDMANAFRSKTPTADIYSTQPREVLPSRPKTPIVDTRNISKAPIKDMNSNSHEMLRGDFNNDSTERSHLRLSLIDSQDVDDEIEINDIVQNKTPLEYTQNDGKYGLYMHIPHRYDCMCFNCQNQRPNVNESNSTYENRKTNMQEWWQSQQNNDYLEMNITLHRQETGFGFRIVGGIEDRSQVAVGHIVAGGAADLDGRIRSGDEIVSVDNFSVLKASHRQVVHFMNQAATRGQVNLVLRRRNYPPMILPFSQSYPIDHMPPQPPIASPNSQTYDVIVHRTENEGFGFVIISSVNKIGSTIGRLIEDSPAEKCGRLRVGDYIVAVNHIDIMHLSHGDIVNLIKDSGLSVTLTIAPNSE